MENLNIYQVKIGSYTRSGNFLSNHEFCCKSEQSLSVVQSHLSEKYKGFSVQVLNIEHIELVDVVAKQETSKSTVKPKEVNKLNLRLDYSYFSLELKEERKALETKFNEYETFYKAFRSKLEGFIQKKYELISWDSKLVVVAGTSIKN